MLLPSRKSQLPANSFRSQYRLRWSLALPEQDRSDRLQMDGPHFRTPNFRPGTDHTSRAARRLCPTQSSPKEARKIAGRST